MLQYLDFVSNGNLIINLANHIIILVALFIFFTKVKYSEKVLLGTVALLFFSVICNALYYGNPFHLITFLIMEIFLVLNLLKSNHDQENYEVNIFTGISFIFIFMGIWYPEFTHTNIVLSLLLSPLGIVPCPTLLVSMGILNILLPKVNKKTFICILVFTTIYGIIGTFVFHVYYDIALLGLAIFSILNLRRHT